jgi:DTW domain-containing protein
MNKDSLLHHRPRPHCWDCFRPQSECLCASICETNTSTRIVLLAHPKEDRRKMSTGRITSRSLKNSLYIVDSSFEKNTIFQNAVSDPNFDTYLLYPGAGSQEVDKICCSSYSRPKQIVLIEATWSGAKRIYRESSTLRSLPKIAFSNPPKSRFRIRTQPAPSCLSTIEATHHVLAVLGEPVEALLGPFDKLVEAQIRHQISTNPHSQRKWES